MASMCNNLLPYILFYFLPNCNLVNCILLLLMIPFYRNCKMQGYSQSEDVPNSLAKSVHYA